MAKKKRVRSKNTKELWRTYQAEYDMTERQAVAYLVSKHNTLADCILEIGGNPQHTPNRKWIRELAESYGYKFEWSGRWIEVDNESTGSQIPSSNNDSTARDQPF